MAPGRNLALVCAAALAVLVSPAQASEPPVDVLAEGPLSYDLGALRSAGALTVPLRNTTGDDVEVAVRIEGLVKPGKDDAALRALFARAGVAKTVPKTSDLAVELPIVGTNDPKPGSYTGTLLVAPTGTGAIARRAVTLTVAPVDKPAPTGATLDPTGLPEVTMPATNFLPSPLAPVGPTLIVLAAVLAVALVIWWRPLGASAGRKALRVVGVIGATVALAAGVVLGAFGSPILPDWETQPGLQLIVSEPLATSANAVTGRVGIVLDGEGDIGKLDVRDSYLRATELEHASEHKGKIDLNGDEEGGAAEATVNVRDWWPWAVAAIVLGVLAGYRVRRWFDRDRPREQLRLRARALSNRVRQALRDGAGLPNWVPRRRTDKRVEEIETLLRDRDTTTEAEEKLKALEAYVEAAGLLRKQAAQLADAAAEYRRAWEANPLDKASALDAAEETLKDGFDGDELDTKSTLLDAAQKRVAGDLQLVQAATASFVRINGWIGDVRIELEQRPAPDREKELKSKQKELEKQAKAVLLAKTVEEVNEADKSAAEQARDVASAPPTPLSDAIAAAGPTATIELEIDVTPGADARSAGNVDDVFRFRAKFTQPPPDGLDVTWGFGDGTPAQVERVPATGTGEWINHTFADPGRRDVTLEAGGSTRDTRTVDVTGPSRLSVQQGVFAERERIFTGVAIALTIASGMLTLYLADPAWGTNEDYVKALLWGAVLSEGVAYVAAILARVYPSAK